MAKPFSLNKYFGTDGIRGKVGGKSGLTPDVIMKLGWAAGKILAKKSQCPVLIGKDTRISGYMFESALEAGLSAAGVNISLLGPMPTPGVAFLTRSTNAQAGIVISASHNPYWDNGVKFFCADGFKLPVELEQEIETQLLTLPIESVESHLLGKASRIVDAPRRYIEYCKAILPYQTDFKGIRIALDCANGATYKIAPTLFEELGATVNVCGNEPNGLNINDECGATKLNQLQTLVKQTQSDLGIALDGDGDRLVMIDHQGNIIDGDDILFIISYSQKKELNGAIVGTVMSNLGFEIALSELDLKLLRSQVGDRHVMELLRQENLILGGENSGHIINLNMSTTGDGIISALLVLQTMQKTGRNLQELCANVLKFPQITHNISLPQSDHNITRHPSITAAVRDIETTLGDTGRLVLRPSGTEPVIRLMIEGEDKKLLKQLARQLATQVKQVVANHSKRPLNT